MASPSNTPNFISNKKIGNLDIFTLRCGNSSVDVSPFGAQIVDWRVGDKPIFFSNPNLIADKSKPLRAGAPLCFPWFNKGANWDLGSELSPSHGPARNSDWKLEWQKAGRESTEISFSFKTDSHLKLPLQIDVTYSLFEAKLVCAFSVKNLSDKPNSFELALHSYFATNDPQKAQIKGLKGHIEEPLNPQIPIDRIFNNQDNPIEARFADLRVDINNSNFPKSVIWHPGLNHALSDLPQVDCLVPFLCLESLTNKISLEPNAAWSGKVEYKLCAESFSRKL